MNHLAAFILRIASVAAWELQGTMRGVVQGARALYRGADRYDGIEPINAPVWIPTARPGKPPRGVTVGGRPVSTFPDPPWASYEEFAAWQESFKVEDPPLTAGGYRDNPHPAPTVERAPRWWERALCAVGIHTGGATDVCKRCRTRVYPA